MKIEDTKVGEHYWAIIDGNLLVVLRDETGWEACGPWECGFALNDLDEIIAEIARPAGHENTPLHYA